MYEKFRYFYRVRICSDYISSDYSNKKIKKEDNSSLDIELEKNEDILKYVSDNFQNHIVGFATETSDVIENAKKNC